MPLQRSQTDLVLADVPNDATTFVLGGTDEINVSALNADVAVELMEPTGRWRDGKTERIRIRAGNFKSIAGLSIAYKPRGVRGFRFYNWTPGQIASVDFDAYSVDNQR